MNTVPRFNVQGVGISALTLTQAVDQVLQVRDQRQQGYVCTCTVHGVGEAQHHAAYRKILNESWLTTADGMPLVWLGRRQGYPQINRVYGPDLMLAVCDRGRAAGLRHYFYGGGPGVAERLRDKLAARFPGLQVAGTFTPPFRELHADEFAALQSDIAQKRPDLIWVGLGTPKQDEFMAANWAKLDTGLMIGVGAAFDFLSGQKKQAPRWMQRSGLEWLFRLGHEPRRLAYRYLVYNPLFLLRAAAQITGLKKYPLV
ncbi:MAG TPA: WecB/TagA/CpsF family glycosyltransferase [Opitutaceae bacterium]|nr:WecB/TagA/CpsF family glycosyltransferase [Opitutaceae bacterium]HRJ46631.1 WecB/TagA/CpsF family glycosyltransferase [Opitutaceae bacterium]